MMKTMVKSAVAAFLLVSAAPVALADNDAPSSSGDAGDQFKSAGQNIGAAARQIGEGVKEGAARAWDAVKAGAQAAGQKLHQNPAPAQGSSDKDPAR